MNKGAHISLAIYLIQNLKKLGMHKRALLIGSILPDCRPSFLTTRHTISETYDLLLSEIRTVAEEYQGELTANLSIHLGVIMHYLADYFIYPHNIGYQGGVKEHIEYEKEQSVVLRRQLQEINMDVHTCGRQLTPDEISDYIKELHMQYMSEEPGMATDCRYIIQCSYTVVAVLMKQMITIRAVEAVGILAA